jgi:hypothetical protein
MTESQFQGKLLRALRSHAALRNKAVIYKHNDRFSAGIPDFSISIGYRTLWLECKMYGNIPTRLQNYYLKKHGDAAAIITCSKNGREMLISPLEAIVGWMDFEQLVAEILTRCVGYD